MTALCLLTKVSVLVVNNHMQMMAISYVYTYSDRAQLKSAQFFTWLPIRYAFEQCSESAYDHHLGISLS